MPAIPLPENASLEHLKNQAKLLLELVRSGDQGGVDAVVEFHPSVVDAGSLPEPFKLADAQVTVARLYGFASWPALRDHLASLDDLGRPDTADNEHADETAAFAALGVVSYGECDLQERIDSANAMLAAKPGLAAASIASMAVAGNHRQLANEIEADPDLVLEPCGPNRWPPLLYCTYSRVESVDSSMSTLEAVRLLLASGADPNAGFLWRGLVPPFTALAGAFGRGEQDQSPHADMVAVARLLLEAGADPNDGQALYNNGLGGSPHDDRTHLELLIEFGLGTPANGPWYQRFGDRLTSPEDLLYDELEVAAHRGLPNRMRLLVGLDLDLTRRVGRSRKTPYKIAKREGHAEILAILAEAGATK